MKTALVTGGNRGIGAAIVRRLAADGFGVMIGYATDTARAEAIRDAVLATGGTAAIARADLATEAGPKNLVDATIARFGRLDALINNAAVIDPAPLATLDAARIDHGFAINVRAVLLTVRHAAAHLPRPGGAIVTIGSINARQAVAEAPVYAAGKAAVESLTRSLAAELGPSGIRVNAIAPGLIMTERQAGRLPADILDRVIAETPLRRLGQPEDIAAAVALLLSPDAAWITGETILATGGTHA